MKQTSFKTALKNKQHHIGLWLSLCRGYTTEITAHSGYDWALIDMEHAANNVDSVTNQLQVLQAFDTIPVVRPAWNEPVEVKRLMDAGAKSFLFPMVQSVKEAEAAVAATRYPPKGVRGVAGITRATAFGRDQSYFQTGKDDVTVIVQIESQKALEEAEEIAKVDGVDGIFFGPADIAADMGIVGQPMAEEVWEKIMPVANTLISQGIPIGTLVLEADFAGKLLRQGFNFVACGIDSALLAQASDQLLKHVRETLQ